MKILSCYKKHKPGEHWTFWDIGVGVALPAELARQLGGEVLYQVVEDRPMQYYSVDNLNCDITYLQKYEIPIVRPKGFVYTFVGDVRGHEEKNKRWIDTVKPDYIGAFEDLPDWLIDFCEERSCVIEFFPWFVVDKIPYNEDRDVVGLCSGSIGRLYPSRTLIYSYLKEKEFEGVCLSCGPYGHYKLSNRDYRDILSRSRYYLTGPIRDLFVAPKYREAANYGAAIISPWVPPMVNYGFVAGKNIIIIRDVREIEDILKSDVWKSVGLSGRKLIHENHTVENRARRIAEVYKDWKLSGKS